MIATPQPIVVDYFPLVILFGLVGMLAVAMYLAVFIGALTLPRIGREWREMPTSHSDEKG